MIMPAPSQCQCQCRLPLRIGNRKLLLIVRPAQVRRQLHAFGAALLHARQAALLQGMLRLAGPLANDPALQLLQVRCCRCHAHAVLWYMAQQACKGRLCPLSHHSAAVSLRCMCSICGRVSGRDAHHTCSIPQALMGPTSSAQCHVCRV